jgi:signal transduction histidine kinase
LNIVANYLKMVGGKIGLRSALLNGSVFEVQLPLIEELPCDDVKQA